MSHIELTDLRILQNIRLSDRAYAITTSTEHDWIEIHEDKIELLIQHLRDIRKL